jgi:protein SCO1/2
MTTESVQPEKPVNDSGGKVARYILLGVIALGLLGIGVALGITVAGGILNSRIDITEHGGRMYDPPRWISEFELTTDDGESFTETDFIGTWTLVSFGYTNCPDFCPLTLSEYKRIKEMLGADADLVRFMLISLDSPRDTPEVLNAYLGRFDEAFIGLTGADEELENIQPDFEFFYERRTNTGSAASYLVDHSTRTYLIDPQGMLCASFSYGMEIEIIVQGMRQQFEDNPVCTAHTSA